MEMKQEPEDEDVENAEDPFESVWVKAETVVVTPDYDIDINNGDVTAKTNTEKKPLQPTKKVYNQKLKKCTLCDFTTVHGNSLKYHMLTHSDDRPFQCEYCDFTSKYPPILKRHKNTLHAELVLRNAEPEILKCTKCNYTTTIKQNLKSHIRKHKKDKQFKCTECNFETAYRHNYVKHIKTHQQDIYRCDKCSFETKYYGHITRHMEKIHNEVMQESKHICEFCQSTSKERWKLKVHQERSIMKYPIRCPYCSFESTYKCQMRKHKKLHDDDNAEGTFNLAKAPNATPVTQEDINKFIQTEPSDTLYKCDKCTFETKFEGHMTRHLETIHNEIVAAGFRCEICSATFTEKYKLRQHVTKSNVKYHIKCTECNFETLYKCEMRRHKKIEHFDDRDRYSYNRLGEIVHNEDEPNVDGFQCEKCPFKTLYETDFTKHAIEAHYLCKLCNNYFPDKWGLDMHIIRGKEDDVIKCTYCDFGSLYRCETRAHISTHFTNLSELPKEHLPQIPENVQQNTGEIRNLLNNYMYDTNLPKAISDMQEKVATPYYRQLDGPITAQMYQPPQEIPPPDVNPNQLGHSKFGSYLIDQNCIDWRSIQVIETNDSVNRYKCPLCDYPSKFKACVQRHFQRHHTNTENRPYKCVNCNFATKTKDAIALHSKRNPPGPLLHCQICNYTTNFKCAFNSHTKFHYGNKCKVCKQQYKHKHELIRHVATKHLGKGIKCHLCDFVALRKDSMASHLLIHSGVKPFPCSLCEYATIRRTLLDVHMRKKHNLVGRIGVTMIDKSKIESLKVPCPEDQRKKSEPKTDHQANSKTATTPNDPIDNDLTEADEFMAPDDYYTGRDDSGMAHNDSGINLNDVIDVDDDVMADDDDPINDDYVPDYQDDCPVDVLSEDVDVKPNIIKEETKKVDVPKPSHELTEFLTIEMDVEKETVEEIDKEMYACDQCGYSSSNMKQLASHISRKHDAYKNYKCLLCPFRTPNKRRLIRHKEIHKNRSAYKCNMCSFKSKSKTFVVRHLRAVHNKVMKTEYSCVYCNTFTSNEFQREAHLKRNRTEKAIVCNMCNFETIYTCQMKKHKFSHLREERDEKDDTLTKPKTTTYYTKVKLNKRSDIKTESDDDTDSSDDDNTFKCERCPFESVSEKNMLKHFIRAHNGCKYCRRVFSTEDDYQVHIQNSKSSDIVRCFFCDFDSDYKCETCKHMCTHFVGFNGVEENDNFVLEDKMANLMNLVETQLKTTDSENKIVENEAKYFRNYDGNTDNIDPDASSQIGMQVEENRYGNFLVNPTHIDNRSLKVEKPAHADAYQCPACEFSTKYRTSMQRHIQRNHAKKHFRPFKCIDCGFAAKSKDSIRKHNQRKISFKKLQCSQCSFTANVKCALAVHQKRHFKSNCKVCGKVFSYRHPLIAHFAVTHLMIGLKCQYCDFYASLKETIIDHESTHTGVKAYRCSICDYSVNRKRLLQVHFRRYHLEERSAKPIKRFKVEVKVEDTSTGELLACDLCNYTNTSKNKLAMHIKRKHSMLFMCEKCPYTTPYKGALKTHSRTHTKYCLYKCIKCPYQTTFKGRILSHLAKVHNLGTGGKEAKLICEFCKVKHRSTYMLKVHQEQTRYDRETKCNLCDFVTMYKCQMEKHETTHTDFKAEPPNEEKFYIEEVITENVLKCRFCNFIGSKRGTVSRHEATHAGEKPFQCNICGFSSKTNLLLMQHWKKNHGHGIKK
ncbi:hypothetical protein O0L34_g12061 [Tuta absoluta]|nr:hypothetical protein O0L34_g12061 [Tuta absoluta]